jgi:uncharacterized protein (TIGR02145 family)
MFAAVFAVSCSVEDGVDGKNGIDGVNGEKGKNANCIISPNEAGGYDVICDNKKVGELASGKNGVSCNASEDSSYFIMVCEDEEKARWPKAMCGPNAYDPETHTCDTRDGKVYRYTKIGNQYWLAENVNYNTNDASSSCYLNYSSYCEKYGRLYDWNAAKTACPVGWSLPNNAKWTALLTNSSETTKFKATSGWNNNGNGTDEFGFSALPGGYYDASILNTPFDKERYQGYWWSDSLITNDSARYVSIISIINQGTFFKNNLLSVRCVKN